MTLFERFIKRAGDASPNGETPEDKEKPALGILHDEQQERLEHELSILDEAGGVRGERLQKEAEKEIRTAAEDSLKKLHVIQRGYCPKCGETLRKHLFASICDACGWHTFDVPRAGPVKVHLRGDPGVVEGERVYVIQTGTVLVLRQDVVVARVPASSVSWVEYTWNEGEIDQRHRQVLERMVVFCAWCQGEADPEKDGFHVVHVAFGAAQERYCFCSDECYEAFRKMYPARVHRNCYERTCSECNLCIKRYGDEVDGVRMLAKDYLKPKPETSRNPVSSAT